MHQMITISYHGTVVLLSKIIQDVIVVVLMLVIKIICYKKLKCFVIKCILRCIDHQSAMVIGFIHGKCSVLFLISCLQHLLPIKFFFCVRQPQLKLDPDVDQYAKTNFNL